MIVVIIEAHLAGRNDFRTVQALAQPRVRLRRPRRRDMGMDAGGGGEPRVTASQLERAVRRLPGVTHDHHMRHAGLPRAHCHLGAIRVISEIAEVAVRIHQHVQETVWVRRRLAADDCSFFLLARMCSAGHFSSIHMSSGLAM